MTEKGAAEKDWSLDDQFIEKPLDRQGAVIVDPEHDLHRGLKARHVAMIAIGGAIGTGLLIGTGTALARAGPGGTFIAYSLVGFVVYLVMCALGEMSAYLPLSQGFPGYASRYVDDAFGFATGWTFLFKYVVVTPNQLTAAALVLDYWTRGKVNSGVFITVFLVVIVFINYFGIRIFGEFEFILSSIKVLVVLGLIMVTLVIACGGGPTHQTLGFTYWKNPGAFNSYIESGATGEFLACWSAFTTATFAYLGTELVGVTVGEIQGPRRVIPRAIRLTLYRILVFYIASVFLLGMCVPYNSPQLLDANNVKSDTATASPFVVAIMNAQIPYLPAIINGAILIFVISAANSDLYIASRTLYGLAKQGKAPGIFTKTDSRGVPIYTLGISILFCMLAYLNVANDSAKVFKYFVNIVTICGLLAWISILYTHICWMRCLKAQGIDRKRDLPYYAPLSPYGSYGALIFCILVATFKGWDTIAGREKMDVTGFITAYIGIPFYLIMIFGYKFIMKSKRVDPAMADLLTGKAEIDIAEADFFAAEEIRHQNLTGSKKFYRRYISIVF